MTAGSVHNWDPVGMVEEGLTPENSFKFRRISKDLVILKIKSVALGIHNGVTDLLTIY